jgi:hypothetical protein
MLRNGTAKAVPYPVKIERQALSAEGKWRKHLVEG